MIHCTLDVKKITREVVVQVLHKITLHHVRFYRKALQRSSFFSCFECMSFLILLLAAAHVGFASTTDVTT